MTEKTNKNQHFCSGCRYYKAFYSKGASAFYREKFGFCQQLNKTVAIKESCVNYKYRQPQEKIILITDLDKTIADLKYLEYFFSKFN